MQRENPDPTYTPSCTVALSDWPTPLGSKRREMEAPSQALDDISGDSEMYSQNSGLS